MEVMETTFKQRMNKTHTRIRCTTDQQNDDFVPGSIESRISMV